MGDMNSPPRQFFKEAEQTPLLIEWYDRDNPFTNPEGKTTLDYFENSIFTNTVKKYRYEQDFHGDETFAVGYPDDVDELPGEGFRTSTIDYIYVSEDIAPISRARVVDTPLALTASDHLPVVVDLIIKRPSP